MQKHIHISLYRYFALKKCFCTTPKLCKNIDYTYFIGIQASRRKTATTRELTKDYYSNTEVIKLAEGFPNEETFPLDSINFKLKNGSSFLLQGPELNEAFQYIPSQGFPLLVQMIEDWTVKTHNPPNWSNSKIMITGGSQDGMSKAFEMCVKEGDAVLVQNPLYTGAAAVLKQFRPILLPVDNDEKGMVPDNLTKVLECWKAICNKKTKHKMPKILYVNPTGSNPDGTTTDITRRCEIYDICCKYNILILEDDPYHFIYYDGDEISSFLSIDTYGRVIRLDSFSKILSPGLRIGWLTGHAQLMNCIELHMESSYLHPSTLSQVVCYHLIKTLTFDGLLEYITYVRDFYMARRDLTIKAMEKHLQGLCEWTIPTGGFYVWFKVIDVPDVYDMLMIRGPPKLIIFAPGRGFMADPTKPCNYIRAAFIRIKPEQIEKAMELLAELIIEEKELIKLNK